MTDWTEIAEQAQRAVEEAQAHREKLKQIEERQAARDERRRAAATVKPQPVAPEPTREEKREAATRSLLNWATGGQVDGAKEVQTETPPDKKSNSARGGEVDKPAKGSFAEKIAKREAKIKVRSDERSAAQDAVSRWLGQGVRW